MAKSNIFTRAKAYVKQHPRTSYQEAIQIVAKGKHKSAIDKKKVAKKRTGQKKLMGVKSVVCGTRPRKRTAKIVATSRPGGLTKIEKAKLIIKDIERLEKERKAIRNKELRDVYALEINAHHKKLSGLHR